MSRTSGLSEETTDFKRHEGERITRSEAEKIHAETSRLQTTEMPEVFAQSSSTESTNSVQPYSLRSTVPTPFNRSRSGMNGNEMREKCREMFKGLEDEQRLERIYMSLQQEKQYDEDLAKFKVGHPDVEIRAQKSLLSEDENLRQNWKKTKKTFYFRLQFVLQENAAEQLAGTFGK